MNKLALIVISALSLSSAAALADTVTVNGGTVHFKGEVVNAACAVDAGSIDQTVQLGQVRSAKLATAGNTSTAVGFNIQLNDCDTTVATKASVAFTGTAIDSANPTVLALQNSAAGGATNVGVQILDRTGTPLALAGNQWDTMLPGGNMRFQGIVIAESCRVEAGDRQMTVKMGQISSNRFHSAGEDTNPVPFDIHLQECSTAVSQRVGVAFHGVADGKNPDVLSVGEGPGIATGIGVALFDKTGSQIPLNAPAGAWTQLHTGPTTLHFVAKYRSTGNQVTGGAANAQAWFSLTYQ